MPLIIFLILSQAAFYAAGAFVAWDWYWLPSLGNLHKSERMGVIFIWLYFAVPPAVYWISRK